MLRYNNKRKEEQIAITHQCESKANGKTQANNPDVI
jgi:hypothetical protein